jgi:hypothetical protein
MKGREMELQQFIAESLRQIFRGVLDAQESIKGTGGSINPIVDGLSGRSYDELTKTNVQDVEFDVALTVTEGKEMKGGIAVLAGALAIGSQGKTDKSNVALTRLRFSVPIALPSRMNEYRRPATDE